MSISNQALYQALSSFKIGYESIAFSFSDRLSRDNKWSASYSERSIIEYKKFIYLSSISNQSLTPSDQVDQVWHLHLTYTRSYWLELCQSILKKDFHHGPTKGGKSELAKYKRQYQDTLALYTKEFGMPPPRDIWPGLSDRFRDADKFIRINASTYWLLPKLPRLTIPLIMFPLFLVACTWEEGASEFWFYVKVAFGIFVAYKVIQWLSKLGNGKGGDGSGCGGCSGCGVCGG